ncbi:MULTISPECIES: hypothetical protein [unclassified Microcoleus]|uniref:hypothetical protein n=1 Tax=unclassified Microcoleus TaxID=2642155 RepID=UPI002FD153F9
MTINKPLLETLQSIIATKEFRLVNADSARWNITDAKGVIYATVAERLYGGWEYTLAESLELSTLDWIEKQIDLVLSSGFFIRVTQGRSNKMYYVIRFGTKESYFYVTELTNGFKLDLSNEIQNAKQFKTSDSALKFMS